MKKILLIVPFTDTFRRLIEDMLLKHHAAYPIGKFEVVLCHQYQNVRSMAFHQALLDLKPIDYVTGMKQKIGDKILSLFYADLNQGKSVPFAYKLSCNTIHMAELSKDLTPILKVRNGKSHNSENKKNRFLYPL